MHIACVISSMRPGGAERVMAMLVNHWAGRGHDVTLVTFSPPGEEPFFGLDDAVRQRRLGESGTQGGVSRALRAVRRIAAIRREIRAARPDCVLSFIDLNNVMTLIAGYRLGPPIIVSERIDPHHYRLGRAADAFRAITYPMADCLIVQTTRAARFFSRFPKDRLAVLPNPIRPARVLATPGRPGPDGNFRMIAVGRLARQKGYDILLAAFAQLAEAFPSWHLDIYGEGDQRRALERLVIEHGLSTRVRLMVPTKDIESELAQANIMAFPSRFEGFPNALSEAMAAGLPAVGFRGVSGVEDLIEDGVSGLLGDLGETHATAVDSLVRNLGRLMGDQALRESMGKAARSKTAQFRPDVVMAQWDELIEVVIRRKRASDGSPR